MAQNLIQSDPIITMGKPVIAGARITVELILEKLVADESVDHRLSAACGRRSAPGARFVAHAWPGSKR